MESRPHVIERPVSNLLHWSTVNHTAGDVHLVSRRFVVFVYHIYVAVPDTTNGARVDLLSNFSGGAANARTRWVGPAALNELQLFLRFSPHPLVFEGLTVAFVSIATSSDVSLAIRVGGPNARPQMSPGEVFDVEGES